jgi:recombination protein RecA
MSQALRKLAGNLNRANTVCLFTNQIREKIGVQFGSPETQPGGRALKFYSSQRLDLRRIETLKEGTEAVGNRVRVKVVKNKVAAPFKQAEFDVEYGAGISREGCLLDLALEHDLIQKSGSFFSYGDTRLGQGRNNTKEFLRRNEQVTTELQNLINQKIAASKEPEPDPKPVEAGADGAKAASEAKSPVEPKRPAKTRKAAEKKAA